MIEAISAEILQLDNTDYQTIIDFVIPTTEVWRGLAVIAGAFDMKKGPYRILHNEIPIMEFYTPEYQRKHNLYGDILESGAYKIQVQMNPPDITRRIYAGLLFAREAV